MTDLPNQRAFHDELPHAIASAAHDDEPLALAVLDIDDFKFLNDRYGHPHGDAVITRVAEILSDRRPNDRAYRVGGDEFAEVLPHTDRDGVHALMRRLARRFEDAGIRMSIGLASLRPGTPPPTPCGPRLMRRSTRPSAAAGTRSSTTRRSARRCP